MEIDGGGNFGRFARSGLMDTYLDQMDEERLAGISVKAWRDFLKQF